MLEKLIISLLVTSSLITFCLAIIASTKIKKKGHIAYALLMICISLYSLGDAFELTSTTIEGIFFSTKIEYIGIVFTPVLWLIFALQYTGSETGKIRSYYPVMFVIPIVTLILLFTNSYHHLYYKSLEIQHTSIFSVAQIERGIASYIFLIYNSLFLLSGDILFFRLMLHSTGFLRKQTMIIVSASFIPWIGDLLYLMGFSMYGIDHTPLFLTAMSPLLLYAMLQLKLLDLTPIARSIIFNDMRDPVLVFDYKGRLADLNNAAKKFLKNYRFVPEETYDGFAQIDADHLIRLIHDNIDRQIQFTHRITGETEYYNSHITEISSSSEYTSGNILTLQDVTCEKRMIDKLQSLATTDDLTGINNRRNLMKLFNIEMEKSRRYNRPLSILLMDLDLFKNINDTYGHKMGDVTLQKVAMSLIQELRSQDILARYGGEEFVVILPETDREKTAKTAERLRKAIETLKIPCNDQYIRTSISIGTFTFDDKNKNQNIENPFSLADEALYKAKENGRNKVVDYDSFSHGSFS